MQLKATYATQDDIPEGFGELYEERNGVQQLTKIEGIKTTADVNRVSTALSQEKEEHRKIKDKWNSFFGENKPGDIQAQLDRISELETAAEGKMDDEKINSLVEGRIKTKTAPIERDRDQVKAKLLEAEQTIASYEAREAQRAIHDSVREAAIKQKVVDSAQCDVLMRAERMFEVNEDGSVTTKDNVGVTPGVTPEVWLLETQADCSHWYPANVGGGAKGSGQGGGFVNNPWEKGKENVTDQMRAFKTDPEKARQMAKTAGVII